MSGCESSRSEAKYKGERSLFLLLMAAGKISDPPHALGKGDGEVPF
jgi:hypothetical protein